MAPANELLQFAEYSPADGTNTAFEIAGLRHVLLVHSQKQNGFCCARIRLLEHHGVEAQRLGVTPIGFGARSKPAQCACQLGGWNGRRSGEAPQARLCARRSRPPGRQRRQRAARAPLSYETCTSVVTTQYPPIIIKVMNEAARALTSMR
jgi:hypothetical protein